MAASKHWKRSRLSHSNDHAFERRHDVRNVIVRPLLACSRVLPSFRRRVRVCVVGGSIRAAMSTCTFGDVVVVAPPCKALSRCSVALLVGCAVLIGSDATDDRVSGATGGCPDAGMATPGVPWSDTRPEYGFVIHVPGRWRIWRAVPAWEIRPLDQGSEPAGTDVRPEGAGRKAVRVFPDRAHALVGLGIAGRGLPPNLCARSWLTLCRLWLVHELFTT